MPAGVITKKLLSAFGPLPSGSQFQSPSSWLAPNIPSYPHVDYTSSSQCIESHKPNNPAWQNAKTLGVKGRGKECVAAVSLPYFTFNSLKSLHISCSGHTVHLACKYDLPATS